MTTIAESETLPLDHPRLRKAHRLYFSLTNHCNRACPWCSTYSSPRGNTWMRIEDFSRIISEHAHCEIQLEGGEPTLHPKIDEFLRLARTHPDCHRLIMCTNGVVLPRKDAALHEWLARLGQPLTLKLSVNHHLLERDSGLLDLAAGIRASFADLGGDRQLVVNVRLRKGEADGDAGVVRAVDAAGLSAIANVFFLCGYGLASGNTDWGLPPLAGHNFTMISPDGRKFGTDIVGCSEAMRNLP